MKISPLAAFEASSSEADFDNKFFVHHKAEGYNHIVGLNLLRLARRRHDLALAFQCRKPGVNSLDWRLQILRRGNAWSLICDKYGLGCVIGHVVVGMKYIAMSG